MGNAIYTSSDSYKTVGVMQPKNYVRRRTNQNQLLLIMNSLLKEKPSLHEDFKPYMGDAMYTSSDSHKTVDVTQPNSYEINELTMMNSLINEKPSQHDDFKPYMGDAMYTSSDSHKTVDVTQPNSYKRNKITMMNSLLKKNPSLHEDFKPYMGDAMYTSSDSHKTVEITQPNSYKKCRNEVVKDNNNNGNHTRIHPDKNECVRNICERLGLLYSKWYNKAVLGFNYYCYKQTGKFVCFLSRGLLMQVSETSFRSYGNKYSNHTTLRVKFITFENNVIMVVGEKGNTERFRPQFGFLSKCKDIITTPFVLLDTAKQHIAKITSHASKLLFIDVVAMLLNIRDGFFTATKLVSILMQLYTIHTRYMNLFGNTNSNNFTRQTGANMTDLLVGFGMLGYQVTC